MDHRAPRNLTLTFGIVGKDITNKANNLVNKPFLTTQNATSRNLSDNSDKL